MKAASPSQLPPGLPPGSELPRARQSARWLARPESFLEDLQSRLGDVFTVHLLHEPPWVVVADPDLVKQVFIASSDVLHAGEPKHILSPVMGSNSVLLEDGERHMRQRRLLLPPFHHTRVAHYEETMRAVAMAEIDRWPLGEPAPAAPRMDAIGVEVILRSIFGAGDGERHVPLRGALRGFMEYLSARPRTVILALAASGRLGEGRFAEARRVLDRTDEAILAEIASRRAMPAEERGDDVLSMLLAARHDDGSPMSDRELRDELMTLFVAGHETTAASLSWALERLVRNSAALERLAAEAPAGGGPYTDAVIQETLRIRSVFMVVPRLVKRPFVLGDLEVPGGVAVAPAIPLVHRRPDLYPQPDEFRPERFLERPPGTYTWIPFGGGVRRCIGAGFATCQMRAVLSTLLTRVDVRAVEEEPERPKRRMLVMAPGRGARVELEPR